MNLLVEAARHSSWFGTKVLEYDPIADRAKMPKQILQDGLNQVGYKGSVARFAYERMFKKDWADFPFTKELLAYTFSRVNNAVDNHRGLVAPQLFVENGRVFKEILHTLCYEIDISGFEGMTPRQYLRHKVGMFRLVHLIHGVTIEPYIQEEVKEGSFERIIDKMMDTQLIGIHRQRRRENLYLTRQADALLS